MYPKFKIMKIVKYRSLTIRKHNTNCVLMILKSILLFPSLPSNCLLVIFRHTSYLQNLFPLFSLLLTEIRVRKQCYTDISIKSEIPFNLHFLCSICPVCHRHFVSCLLCVPFFSKF